MPRADSGCIAEGPGALTACCRVNSMLRGKHVVGSQLAGTPPAPLASGRAGHWEGRRTQQTTAGHIPEYMTAGGQTDRPGGTHAAPSRLFIPVRRRLRHAPVQCLGLVAGGGDTNCPPRSARDAGQARNGGVEAPGVGGRRAGRACSQWRRLPARSRARRLRGCVRGG